MTDRRIPVLVVSEDGTLDMNALQVRNGNVLPEQILMLRQLLGPAMDYIEAHNLPLRARLQVNPQDPRIRGLSQASYSPSKDIPPADQ